jgi:hypothetical protein
MLLAGAHATVVGSEEDWGTLSANHLGHDKQASTLVSDEPTCASIISNAVWWVSVDTL